MNKTESDIVNVMSQVSDEIAVSLMPRVQGLLTLLNRSGAGEDDQDVGAAYHILRDVRRELEEVRERAVDITYGRPR